MVFGHLERLLKHDAAGGVLLLLSALLALFVANSHLAPYYDALLSTKLSVLIDGEGL